MRSFLEEVFLAALERNRPEALLEAFYEDHAIDSEGEVYVMAAGKAAGPMAQWLVDQFRIPADKVIAVVPGASAGTEPYIIKASHPVPDDRSLQAGEELMRFVQRVPAGATVLFAISGGTSALVCKPAEGIGIEVISTVNQLLIQSGASIHDINCVRKHLSQIKGGQLLRHFNADVELIDLIISDVPGDDLSVIGSGLTTPDATTFGEAIATLKKYDLWQKVEKAARTHLREGSEGKKQETLKPGEDPLKKHTSYIIGSAAKFARTIAEELQKRGFNPVVADEPYTGPVQEVAENIFRRINQPRRKSEKPLAFIFYGESTVRVTGSGKGGRNQELALRGALKIAGMDKVQWLSAGTDGIDGPTDAAGAIADGDTIKKAEAEGLDVREFLENNDSYRFHRQMDTLLITGPTGNNVMDVTVVLVKG